LDTWQAIQGNLSRTGLLFVACVILGTSPSRADGDDTALRQQVAELAPLMAHYAVRLATPEVCCFNQDINQFRMVADRLAREGATPEIRELAEGCRQNLHDIDSLVVLWQELQRDTPAPESQFWKLQEWVWSESAKGSFQTEVTEYSNGIATRSYTTDDTLTMAAGAAVAGMVMDRVARQKHVSAELQRKQAVGARLGKLGDAVEQRRLQLQQKLLAIGYIPFAGPKKAEPLLQARIALQDEKGSPIEEWEKERKRQAYIEQQVAAGQPLSQPTGRVSGPQLRIRNVGPTLHRVALRIDYKHYRQPDTNVVRQTYFLAEWPAGEDLEIIDEFRLNGSNRATAGFFEEMLSPNEGLGMRVMPGFQGVVELTYALASDEVLQGPVTLKLDDQRKKLADNCLEIAEHWSWMVTQGIGPNGPLRQMPPQQSKVVQNIMTETSKKFAKAALALKALEPEDAKLAESLTKNVSAIAQRSKDRQTELLNACRSGRVYSTQILPQRAGYGFYPGVYDLVFTSEKPTATKIEAVLTRRATETGEEQKTPYTGRLVSAPTGPGFVLELQSTATAPPLAGAPGIPRAPITLRWVDSQWRYGEEPDDCFRLTGDSTASDSDRSMARNSGKEKGRSSSLGRLPIDSVWEGTRKFVDSHTGAVLREETIVVTIRKSWRTTDVQEHFEGEFIFDQNFPMTGDIALSLNGSIQLRPTTGRRGDPYRYPLQGKLLGNVIEGAVPAGSGKRETELIRLVKKP